MEFGVTKQALGFDWVWRAGAEAFPARIWRRGARVGLVGGNSRRAGTQETDVRAQMSVGLSGPACHRRHKFCRLRCDGHEPARGPLMSVRLRRARVRLCARLAARGRQAGIEERAVQAFCGCGLDFWGPPYDWLVRTATSVRGIRFSFSLQGKEDAATALCGDATVEDARCPATAAVEI